MQNNPYSPNIDVLPTYNEAFKWRVDKIFGLNLLSQTFWNGKIIFIGGEKRFPSFNWCLGNKSIVSFQTIALP
jgi:hypothetical protein